MNNPIAHALEQITLGDPVTFENITMIPLLGPASAEQEPFYLTLDEALAQGWTEITEISEQGSVPELRVINKGAKPVFILDGEELLGAKQNRIVNLSILVAAKTTVTIPVSCVEAGRWRSRSRAFSAAPRTQYAAGRAKRMAQVTASMQMSGARFSGPGRGVGGHLREVGAPRRRVTRPARWRRSSPATRSSPTAASNPSVRSLSRPAPSSRSMAASSASICSIRR